MFIPEPGVDATSMGGSVRSELVEIPVSINILESSLPDIEVLMDGRRTAFGVLSLRRLSS